MAVLLPSPYGKADWTDYEDYWREADAEWLQARAVLRVADDTGRLALAQTPGGVVYNYTNDSLELCSRYGGYKTITPVSSNLSTTELTGPPISTVIAHKDAGGEGIAFSGAVTGVTTLGITTDRTVLNGGVLTVEPSGVSVKTGTKIAKLTTDATNLISDSPISAPGLALTGGALAASGRAATVGSLSVEGALTSASVTATGAVNGASALIAGVTIASNKVNAPGGLESTGGAFYGDATSAQMRQRNTTTGVAGTAYMQTTIDHCYAGGTGFFMNPTLYIRGGKAINYYDAGGNFRGYIAPNIYGADPGVANVPDGTIWIS